MFAVLVSGIDLGRRVKERVWRSLASRETHAFWLYFYLKYYLSLLISCHPKISWISVHPPCWQAALNAQNLSMFYSSRSSWKSHCCSLLERERHAETVRNFVRTWRPSPAPASIFLNSWFAKFLVIFIPASLIPTWGFKQDLLQIIERNLAFTCWAVTPWVGGPLWAC